MRKTTLWRPDTCSCVIEYEWDDAVPEDGRTHTATTVQPCARHAAGEALDAQGRALNPAAVFAKTHGENVRKNLAVTAVVAELPAAERESARIAWTIDPGGNISVEAPASIPAARQAVIQSKLPPGVSLRQAG